MTVAPGELEAGQVEQAQRAVVEQAALDAALAAWSQIEPARALAQWYAGLGARIFAALALAQETVAALGNAFVSRSVPEFDIAVLDTLTFAGRSSEDRAPLEPVLRLAAVRAQQQVAVGIPAQRAAQSGRDFLTMTIRTEIADAARAADQAALVSATEPGEARPTSRLTYGWVRVTDADPCSRCAILAGRFYRWNDGFARHPNCFPAGTVVDGPMPLASSRRWYEGELVLIRTASGKQLTVTGNHPILTGHGWIPARMVDESSHLATTSGSQGASPLVVPQENQVPVRIEDLHGSLGVPLGRMPTTPQDFHGDGGNGDVDIVLLNRLLRDRAKSLVDEVIKEVLLAMALCSTSELSRLRSLHKAAERLLAASHSLVSSGDSRSPSVRRLSASTEQRGFLAPADLNFATLKAAAYDVSGNTVSLGDGVFRLSRDVGFANFVDRQVEFPARWDAPPGEFSVDTAAGYASRGQDLLKRLSGQVMMDRVVQVTRSSWSGHVYNLTSSEGWYRANGVIVSNCACIHLPRTVVNPDLLDPAAYFASLPPAEQDRVFGAANAEAIRAGADIYRVVNAATRGKVRIASDGRRTVDGKPTVWQIIKDARGDRALAAARLAEFGYIRA